MIVGEHPIKDVYRRLVWGPGRRALEALPAPMELHALDLAAGAAARALSGRRARLAENLGRAFPDKAASDLNAITIAAFQAHFANQYAGFSFEKCRAENADRYLELRGLEHLQRAWAEGRGVVLMHPHMGPAQLPLHVLGRLGWPVHQIGGGRIRGQELSKTGRWAAQTRDRLEARMPVTLHDGKRYLRPLLRALQRGDVVLTACDATGGGEELGRRVERQILGQRFPVPLGPVWLALQSGAALLTLVCHRGKKRPYTAEIGPEIALPRQDRRAALEVGADETARFVDRCLRTWPGDWLFWDGFKPGGLLAETGP